MVWWANTIGETFVIPTEIIGLTILAAGTSIPDLITRWVEIFWNINLQSFHLQCYCGSKRFGWYGSVQFSWFKYFRCLCWSTDSVAFIFSNRIYQASKWTFITNFCEFKRIIMLCWNAFHHAHCIGLCYFLIGMEDEQGLLKFIQFSSLTLKFQIFGILMIVSYVFFCVFSVSLETDKLVCPLNICG